MDRKIKLKDLAVLHNIISRRQPRNIREIIQQHYEKRNIDRRYPNEYRPGSADWQKIEDERAVILAYPDHDIKYTDEITIISDRYNETVLRFTLGVYTVDEHHHDYDGCSYMETAKYYFLVHNQYWLHGVYTKFSDLFTEYHNLVDGILADYDYRMFYDFIKQYNKEYQEYFYLFEKEVKKALSYGYDVDITQDRNYHGVGQPYLKIDGLDGTKKYYLDTLDEILKIKYYWYNDRKTKFGDNYHFNSVMEEYEYAKDNICVEEENS
jgi:hypothetical protein